MAPIVQLLVGDLSDCAADSDGGDYSPLAANTRRATHRTRASFSPYQSRIRVARRRQIFEQARQARDRFHVSGRPMVRPTIPVSPRDPIADRAFPPRHMGTMRRPIHVAL